MRRARRRRKIWLLRSWPTARSPRARGRARTRFDVRSTSPPSRRMSSWNGRTVPMRVGDMPSNCRTLSALQKPQRRSSSPRRRAAVERRATGASSRSLASRSAAPPSPPSFSSSRASAVPPPVPIAVSRSSRRMIPRRSSTCSRRSIAARRAPQSAVIEGGGGESRRCRTAGRSPPRRPWRRSDGRGVPRTPRDGRCRPPGDPPGARRARPRSSACLARRRAGRRRGRCRGLR